MVRLAKSDHDLLDCLSEALDCWSSDIGNKSNFPYHERHLPGEKQRAIQRSKCNQTVSDHHGKAFLSET